MCHCIPAQRAFTASEDILNRISVEGEVTEHSLLLIEAKRLSKVDGQMRKIRSRWPLFVFLVGCFKGDAGAQHWKKR